jgi:2-C-methyl-D-erythritol 2,4-cyclodiphosphate synthase
MIRTGIGFDVHKFDCGRRLILGGVCLPHPRGLLGHSDADVLCHAVADALLGAIADGDIGRHFPDTDAAWKDASSLDILRLVGERVRARKARIQNIDATVLAQAPRIAPYADAMRANLATALAIEVSQVSVKATTAEGLGTIGREEGIAVMAVAGVEARNRRRRADLHPPCEPKKSRATG